MSRLHPKHPVSVEWLVGVAITVITLCTSFSLNINEKVAINTTRITKFEDDFKDFKKEYREDMKEIMLELKEIRKNQK